MLTPNSNLLKMCSNYVPKRKINLNSLKRTQEMYQICLFFKSIYEFRRQDVPTGIQLMVDLGPKKCFATLLEYHRAGLCSMVGTMTGDEKEVLMFNGRNRTARDFANWYEDVSTSHKAGVY